MYHLKAWASMLAGGSSAATLVFLNDRIHYLFWGQEGSLWELPIGIALFFTTAIAIGRYSPLLINWYATGMLLSVVIGVAVGASLSAAYTLVHEGIEESGGPIGVLVIWILVLPPSAIGYLIGRRFAAKASKGAKLLN